MSATVTKLLHFSFSVRDSFSILSVAHLRASKRSLLLNLVLPACPIIIKTADADFRIFEMPYLAGSTLVCYVLPTRSPANELRKTSHQDVNNFDDFSHTPYINMEKIGLRFRPWLKLWWKKSDVEWNSIFLTIRTNSASINDRKSNKLKKKLKLDFNAPR